jgi:acetyl-CoA acyltransferase
MRAALHDVVLVDAVRTPFGRGRPDGLYATTRGDDLAVKAVRELLRRHPSLPPERIDDVVLAATSQVGDQGLTLGRTVALLAGLPAAVPGFAVDRMCAGATTAITVAAGAIATRAQQVVVAGGLEHMGRHPMAAGADPNPRFGTERLVDRSAMVMGATAENLHDRDPRLTRSRADAWGVRSQARYAAALAAGHITPDLVPVAVLDPERGWTVARADEPPRPGTTLADVAGLPTPFRPGGRVTAATSAPLTDGAAVALLAHADAAAELGLPTRLRMVSYAFAGVEPEVMGLGPVPATIKALALAGLGIEDVGLIEINEAFAVQVLAFLGAFGLDDEDPRVNPLGGAIAVGHPLAASGARLVAQLAGEMERRPDVLYGLTTLCVGLGMGASIIWENPHHEEARR